MDIEQNDIPKWLIRELMRGFKNTAIDGDGWFPIHNERANDRLCGIFGLATTYAEYKIGNSFRVRFDWAIQRWRVSA